MKCFFNISLVLCVLLAAFIFTGNALDVSKLSPNSHLKKGLDKLGQKVKNQVIDKLKRIPDEDHEHLRVNERSNELFYVDDAPDVTKIAEFSPEHEKRALEFLQEAEAQADNTRTAQFLLHSRKGAKNVLFLNFQGETVSNTAWNATTFTAAPFSLDNITTAFSLAEATVISSIWMNVAEDYAPWNIDVTTERPTTFTQYTGQIVITLGQAPLPSYNIAGGISYVGVFGTSNYYMYRPGFCYYNMLGSSPKAIAECCSHEFGHNLGLSHDGTVAHDGLNAAGYSQGTGSGPTGWAPIMGAGYYKPITQWSAGEYPYANNQQNDIAIITASLGLAGPALATTPSSNVQTTSIACPVAQWTISGLVNSNSTNNTWTFTLPITAAVNIQALPNLAVTGSNLDINMVVMNSIGTVISNPSASAPNGTTSASYVSTSLAAGTYTVTISGGGDGLTGYSNYGSLGTYLMTICATRPALIVSKKRSFRVF